jgi:hypothetical protein
MKGDTVARISRQVVRTFPEMDGVHPTVRAQDAGQSTDVYLLTYKGRVSLPTGKSMSRIVRVTADAGGRIIRISTSR